MPTRVSKALSTRTSMIATLVALLVLGGAGVSQAAPSNISISKVADQTTVHTGDAIGFVITVTNPGPATLTNVSASDQLPTDAGTAWSIDSQSASACSISNGTMTCSIGTLAAGASYTVHVASTTTSATADSSPVDNTATANSGKGGSAIASASIEILTNALVPTRTVASPTVAYPATCGFGQLPPIYSLCLVSIFRATVIAENGAVVNEGTVTFTPASGYGPGCVAPVQNGVAGCSSQPSPSGHWRATATFSGSATFAPSSSS